MKEFKNIVGLTLVGLVVLTALSCGGGVGEAPPVSLPTPVTGRILISSPDESGMITITGETGSVDASSTVLAINENAEIGFYDHVLGVFLGTAYADDDNNCPGSWSGIAYSCATSDTGGAFEMQIAGAIGDDIVIVLVDSEGNETSERITKEIPEGVFPTGEIPVGVARYPGDAGKLLLLLKGGTESGSTVYNSIVEFDLSAWQQGATHEMEGYSDAAILEVGTSYTAVADVASTGLSSAFIYENGSFDTAQSSLVNITSNQAGTPLTINDMIFASSVNNDILIMSVSSKDTIFAVYNYLENGYSQYQPQNSSYSSVSGIAISEGTVPVGTNATMNVIASLERYVGNSGSSEVYLQFYKDDTFLAPDGPHFTPTSVVGGVKLSISGEAEVKFMDDAGHLIVTDVDGNNVYKFTLQSVGEEGVVEPEFEVTQSWALGSSSYSFLSGPQYIEGVDYNSKNYILVTSKNNNASHLDTLLKIDVDGNMSDTGFNLGLTPTGIVYDGSQYVYAICATSHSLVRINTSSLFE